MAETELSTRDDAVARAERIRAGIRSLAELQQDIADAYHARDWVTLGYETWDAYITGEFGGAFPRLGKVERRELVVNLRAEGLSTRAIASATGSDRNTVMSDLKVAEIQPPADEPSSVVGIDGKTYEPKRLPITTDEAMERKSDNDMGHVAKPAHATRRAPLPKFAADKVSELWRLSDALQRIVKDERFAANRAVIRQYCEAELNLAQGNLTAFREALEM